MLNNEKIVLMTKLALYEQGEGKKKIPVGKCFKSDYIGMRMLSSFIYINIAYIICVAIWFMVRGEGALAKLLNGNIASVVTVLGIIYAIVVIVYMTASYVYFTYKFKCIRRSLKEYNAQLKQLHSIQEKEMDILLNEAVIDMEMEGEES